jgi:hypothetical protein
VDGGLGVESQDGRLKFFERGQTVTMESILIVVTFFEVKGNEIMLVVGGMIWQDFLAPKSDSLFTS